MSVLLPKSRPVRILVTRADRIGDFVLSTPVFEALRNSYPDAWIAGLTLIENRELAIGNPFLDETRMDWVHFGEAGFTATAAEPAARLLSLMSSGGVVVTDPRYCGEITYTADADACGNFLIDFVDPGAIKGVSRTTLADPDSHAFDFVADGVEVRVGTEVFGDADGSGRVDLVDVLCVVDGFANEFDRCTLETVDLVPCNRDGIVDLRDILAVLDAFEGLPAPCSSGSCDPGSASHAAR